MTLDGKLARDEILTDLTRRVAALSAAGRTPGLGTVLVGGWFCARAVRFRRSPSEAEARRLFRASLAYLPAQFALMLLLG